MSYSFDSPPPPPVGFNTDGPASSAGVDHDMQKFVLETQTQAQFNDRVRNLTAVCWDKCVSGSSYGSKMDDRKANCLKNCSERFVDLSIFIQGKMQESLMRLAQQ